MTKLFRNPGIRYLATFAIVGLALFSVLATPWAERLFVQPFTQGLVDVTAFMVRPFDARVVADGDILRFSDGLGAVQVLAGCNAVEVCALLAAAILAFPARFRDCLIGAVLGIVALQTVNLFRIITLLYLSRGSQEVFEFFHHYVWDAMIGLEGLLVFFFWARWQGRQERAARSGETSAEVGV
ncbi:exosortase H [Brevundimonas variabilis]|uniref:Exosortase H (IPTLxxWG-CTERM-specific) n=1 Tax=Brevundimonas variabilis TaxID=74312 RepID=A0A7W9CIP1_9CAUL|nr:exosortase H [Brevundimonas variabilis]MBB5746181.1 exosortase H (IPTLxxWG-CTERM-specific) [Brevundimonas variabilis]